MTLADEPIGAFFSAVASQRVTPSGGAVAALVGAASASLCEMVCTHTIGKGGYGDVERELARSSEQLRARRDQLLELADEDIAAVEQLQSTFDGSGSGATGRQQAAKRATDVPLETAELCLDILESAVKVIAKGTQTAIADARTGVFLAHAALRASTSTARANLELIDDEVFVSEREECLTRLEQAGNTTFDRANSAAAE